MGNFSNALNLNLPVPLSDGGTFSNGSSYSTNGVFYFDGTQFQANSVFTYDGNGNLGLNSGTFATQFSISTTNTSSGEEARLLINRGSTATGYAQIHLQSNNVEDWVIGTRMGTSTFSCLYTPSISTNIGYTVSTNGLLHLTGNGANTASASLATFTSPNTPTTTNIYSISVVNQGVDLAYLGVNQSAAATGNIPAGAVFLSSYQNNSTICIGRGNGNVPNSNDLMISGTSGSPTITANGTVNISSLSASQLVTTDSSKNLISGGAIPLGFSAFATVTSSTQSMTSGTLYYNNYSGGQCAFTLPSSPVANSIIGLIGLNTSSASGWIINASGSQQIQIGSSVGVAAGSLTSNNNTDICYLIYAASNLWVVYNVISSGLSLL